MKKVFTSILLLAALLMPAFISASAQTESAFVNTDFSSTDGWTAVVSEGFRDYGSGAIGSYRVRTDDFIPAATVDDTHLETEYCIGVEARWAGNFASYTQVSQANLPAGNYSISFDVENVNAGTTKATYENRFFVTVGEQQFADEQTEWMDGKSSWTTHTIFFTVTEE
nr:hypothetical protein [Bacteroidaceae bacterium]